MTGVFCFIKVSLYLKRQQLLKSAVFGEMRAKLEKPVFLFAWLAQHHGRKTWRLLDYFAFKNPVFTVHILFAQDKK